MDQDFQDRRSAMTAAGYWRDKTLLDYLGEAVSLIPEKTAVVSYKTGAGTPTRLTYELLDDLSSRIASRFAGLGVSRGDVVSFELPNWWEVPLLHLACLKLGAVSNPLTTIQRERELRFMLGQAESRILIVPSTFRGFDFAAMAFRLNEELPSLKHVFIAGDDGEHGFSSLIQQLPNASAPLPPSPLKPDDVIQLLYSSGTTGEPKGVMHSSNTMLSNLEPFAERLGLGPADVIHMPSPLGHQLGFMYGLVLPIMLGSTTVLQDIFNPEQMARQINAENATFTMGATPFLDDFVSHVERSGLQTPSLRVFVSAGAPIPRELVSRAGRVLHPSIISGWGMSENGAVTTTCLDDPDDLVTETDGCALPGMELCVRDASGGTVRPNETGELMVRGCSNFIGYFKRPGLAEIDDDGWFKTGDLARMDERGYIRITGRSKDIIIRGGENVPAVEVEELLYRHPAVAGAAVVGCPHPRLGEQVCAFVILHQGCQFSFEDMTSYLRSQQMAVQYIPERLNILPAFPMTPSGKVQKFRLRELAIAKVSQDA